MSGRTACLVGFALAMGLFCLGCKEREIKTSTVTSRTKTALLVLRDQVEKYKDQFGVYPIGTGADGAPELVAAMQKMGVSVQSVVGKDICPNNATLQDAWGNPIRYYYNSSGTTVGAGYDTRFQQNNRTPLYVSPGPNGKFDGSGDDIIVP